MGALKNQLPSLSLISIPLALCCDWFNHGPKQEKCDLVDLLTVNYNATRWYWIPTKYQCCQESLTRYWVCLCLIKQGRIHVWAESAPAPPFWQINHANSAYFRLFLGYFGVISATRPPLLDLGLPFLHILDPPWIKPQEVLKAFKTKYIMLWSICLWFDSSSTVTKLPMAV